MDNLRRLFLLCLLAVSSGVLAKEPSIPALPSLLPEGTNQVYLLRPSFSTRTKELEGRMQAAIKSRSDWWLGYVKKNADIRPLPYHTNLGLTEAEYRTLLELYKTKGLTRTDKTMVLQCQYTGPHRILLSSPQLPLTVAPLVIDTDSLVADTPLARLGEARRIDIQEKDGGGIFGPQRGYRWHLEQGNVESGQYLAIDLNVLSRTSDDRVFLYYTGKRLENGAIKVNFELILELPQRAAK